MAHKRKVFRDPKYVSKRTRVLSDVFPKKKKDIIQHDATIIAIVLDIDNRTIFEATIDAPEEFVDLWMSED